jgi:RHS repeat-associated protein
MKKIIFLLGIISSCAFTSTTAQNLVVGSTDGTFDVSALGGANYTIPIKIPSGIGGMQPSVSLNYSSQGGNGIMGMGWSLNGLSAITRVSNNIYNDKNVNGVMMNATDKFALDGSRLVLTSGSTYGVAASQYNTEIENFKTVTAVGALGSGPASFTVTDQDGLTYEYGAVATAQVKLNGITEPYSWLLDKVTDLKGNFMTYEYTQNANGETLLSYIKYGSNSVTGFAFQSYINFQYATKSDPEFRLVGGARINSTMKLTKIVCVQKNPTTWYYAHTYNLAYATDFYTHLTSVTELGENNADVMAPTQFAYGATSTSFTETQVGPGAPANYTGIPTDFAVGDYNGDGKSDLIQYTQNYDPNNNTFELYLNTGNGFSPGQIGQLPTPPANYDYNDNVNHPRGYSSKFTDFNGDGMDDLIFQSTKTVNTFGITQYLNVLLSNGTSLASGYNHPIGCPNQAGLRDPYQAGFFDVMPLSGDFDGDGKTEILELNTYLAGVSPIANPNALAPSVSPNNFLVGANYLIPTSDVYGVNALQGMPFDASYVSSGTSKLFVIDYDGDGKDEILSIWKDNATNTNHAQVFKLNVTFDANNKPTVGNPAFVNVSNGSFPTLDHDIHLGDFNGDGITDVLTYIYSVGWQIGYGDGKGIFSNNVLAGPSMNKQLTDRPLLVADFNGDGKSDIFDFSPSDGNWGTAYGPRIWYSQGNNVFVMENVAIDQTHFSHEASDCWMGDYNGDGSTDILSLRTFSDPKYTYLFHPDENRHKISTITNGLGSATSVAYKALSSSVYASGSNAYTYPFIKRTIPFHVVSSIIADNGVNTTGNTKTYSYTGLKFNAWGKGLMGFDTWSSFDVATSIGETKSYGLNTTYAFPFLASQSSSLTTYIHIGNFTIPQATTLLDKTTNTNAVYNYGGNRIFPYITESDNSNYINNTSSNETYNYTTPPVFPQIGIAGTTYSTTIGKPMSITTNKGNGMEITTKSFSYPPYQTNTFSGGTINVVNYPVFYYSKPSVITTTVTRSGQPAYTRKSNLNYSGTNGLLNSTVTDPGTANSVTTTLTYDAYSNITQKSTSATGLTTINEMYNYDPTNRFIIKSYNAAFPAVQKLISYDGVIGTTLSTTTEDGLITSYTYDGFGNVKTTSTNNGVSAALTYAQSGGAYAPANASYFVETTPNTASPAYKFYDRLNRKVRTAYPGFDNTMIYEDVTYNAIGQIATKSKPYFQGSSPANIVYTYDNVGRQSTEVLPEGTSKLAYAISGANYVVTATDMNQQQKITTTDASGKIISVTDNGGTLNYTYHSNGEPLLISSTASGTVSQITYDDFGRKIKQFDPNYGGSTTFLTTYNAYNQKTSQTDPHGNSYTFTYDVVGNNATKVNTSGSGEIYNYTYSYAAGPNCGKLIKLTGLGNTHSYDYGLGDKINSETSSIDGGQSFTTSYTYDAMGRVATLTYPNGTQLAYTYNPNDGTLQAKGRAGVTYIPVAGPSLPQQAQLYSVISKNAMGEITQQGQKSTTIPASVIISPFLGYSFGTTQSYDAFGYLSEQNTSTSGIQPWAATVYKDIKYQFQGTTGNLLQRKDVKNNLQEDFHFDNLNRLDQIQGQNLATSTTFPLQTMDYLSNGNIQDKSDAGSFAYDMANRVSEISPYVDVPEAEQTLTYTPFNKVSSIVENANNATFTYWADGTRSSMTLSQNNSPLKTKYYAPNFEREIDALTGITRDLCYVTGTDGHVVAILEKINSADNDYFVETDHLGSINQIIDANGNIVNEKSFDAWGRSRDPHTWAALAPINASDGWDRGYTGHEAIPQFGIINMNGRLYDPLLGRMFSPDDNVSSSDNTQSYNRYSYCLNNPLKYSDRNGEYAIWDDLVVGFIGFAVGYVEYAATTHNFGWKALGNGALSAGIALAGYYTLGAATAAGETSGIISGVAEQVTLNASEEFLAGYTVASTMSFMMNQKDIEKADKHGWNGVILGAGYNILAAVDAGFTVYGNVADAHAGAELYESVGNGAIDGFGNYILQNGYDPETGWKNLKSGDFWRKSIWAGANGALASFAGDFASGDLSNAPTADYIVPDSKQTHSLYILKNIVNKAASTVVQNFGDLTEDSGGKFNFRDYLKKFSFEDLLNIINDGRTAGDTEYFDNLNKH